MQIKCSIIVFWLLGSLFHDGISSDLCEQKKTQQKNNLNQTIQNYLSLFDLLSNSYRHPEITNTQHTSFSFF